jgi:hypothetical protein
MANKVNMAKVILNHHLMDKAHSITRMASTEVIINMADNLKGKRKKARKERREKNPQCNLHFQVKVR